jgi:hypothetical protein
MALYFWANLPLNNYIKIRKLNMEGKKNRFNISYAGAILKK